MQDFLNNLARSVSPADLVVAAGTVAMVVQSYLNKLSFLQHAVAEVQDVRRFLVSVVLPFLGTYLTGLVAGQNTLQVAPWVFLVSQFVFYGVKALQQTGAAKAAQTVTQPGNPESHESGETVVG